ncbi:MAG: sugar ABC transporter substrate-binding protein [Lachnospiraceae bacterium]|nr:sugar ABC transporter substrate-binding protein [Lachnospiraceae bacterium]
MKLKRVVSLFLVSAMAVTLLAGCGKDKGTNGGAANEGGAASNGKYADAMVIENFNVAANYQGVQTGWFGQLVKDKFNLEINVIAPQVGGDALYQTRTAEGNLGDLLILEKSQWQDCIQTGLIKDISDKIYATGSNLTPFKKQIDNLNGAYDGKIYGIPTEMMDTSPTSVSVDDIYSSPRIRWDLYTQIGAPEIKDLEGLIDTLKKMMDAAPVNDAGDKCYGLSLWPDWDGGDAMLGIANVVQLTTWYGEKIKQSVILKPDGTFIPLTDKNGSYYKILKFLNHAQRAGIVDPDSATQNWDSACAKMGAGQVYLEWYSWQVGFWSVGHMQDGRAHRVIPITDQIYYADADAYYGSGRVWAIGSKVDDAKYERIMDFIQWYTSPEGLMYQHCGIEGFNYYKGEDGRLYTMNESALAENMNVPAEFGGAGYSDGNNKLNQWIIGSNCTNPLTGEPYATSLWSSYKEATDTQMVKDWRAKYNAETPVDYFRKNNKLVVSPNISVPLESDSADIQVIRNQCNECVCDASWVMIYAKDDAEFDKLWDKMTKDLDGLGFQDLMAWDKKVYTVELEAKNAVK